MTYGAEDYKGIFRKKSQINMHSQDATMFKNKYLENRLQKIYKRSGVHYDNQ